MTCLLQEPDFAFWLVKDSHVIGPTSIVYDGIGNISNIFIRFKIKITWSTDRVFLLGVIHTKMLN